MKKLIFILILITISSLEVHSQSWSQILTPDIQDGDSGFSKIENISAVCTDSSGNIYVTGYFDGKIIFGNDVLTAVDGYDSFVAKADDTGQWQWAKIISGNSTDKANDIACDNLGNCYITGYFYKDIHFGTIDIEKANNKDIFVAKINSSGHWQWAKQAGGSMSEESYAVCVDDNSNAYITGWYTYTTKFDSFQKTSTGSKEVFVAKINPSGTWQWLESAGGSSTDYPKSITYGDNQLYLTGYFYSTSNYGSNTLISEGSRDIFIANISTSGTWDWAISAGGTGYDEGFGIIYNNDVLYTTGRFSETVTFDTTPIVSEGQSDAYFASLSTAGDWNWVSTGGGDENDEGYEMFVYNSKIYFSGTFRYIANFGTTTIGAIGQDDIFICKLDKGTGSIEHTFYGGSKNNDILAGTILLNTNNFMHFGNCEADISFGSLDGNNLGNRDVFSLHQRSTGSWLDLSMINSAIEKVWSTGVAIDSDGNRYVVGGYYGKIKFGNTILESSGLSDVFIVKYDVDGSCLWAKSAGSTGDDNATSVVIDNNNMPVICGSYSDNADFDGTIINAEGDGDIFVAKYTTSGNLNWINQAGSEFIDRVTGIDCDSLGNIYIGGDFLFEIYFDGTKYEASDFEDIYVAKLNSSGSWQWVSIAGKEESDICNDLDVGSDGNIYISGKFIDSTRFGSYPLRTKGFDDIYVAKINSSGVWQNALSAGSSTWHEGALSVQYLQSGKILVGGYYNGLAYFGTDYLLTLNDNLGGFLAVVNSSFQWDTVYNYGGKGYSAINDIKERTPFIYIAGVFDSTVTIGTEVYSNLGGKDLFMVKYDSLLNVVYSAKAGGDNDDEVSCLALWEDGEIFLSGYHSNNTEFGSTSLITSSPIDVNGYLAKNEYIPDPPPWAIPTLTSNAAIVNIAKTISINYQGISLSKGDAIGVFYAKGNDTLCAGYSQYMKTDMSIVVRGDNLATGEQDGIQEGDLYRWVYWNAQTETETDFTANILAGPRRFNDNGQTELKQIPMITDSQKIELKKGWNMISARYAPKIASMDSILIDVIDDIVIVKNQKGEIFYPQYDINQIGDWDERFGFLIYANKSTSFYVHGDSVRISDEPINMVKGWNLMSVFANDTVKVTTAITSIMNDFIIIKNKNGRIYYPQYGINTIKDIIPGESYLIYMYRKKNFYMDTD